MITQGYFIKLSRIFGRQDAEDLAQELTVLAWKLQRKGWEDWKIKQGVRYKAMDYRRAMSKRMALPISECPPDLPEFREEFRHSLGFVLEIVARTLKRAEDKALLERIAYGDSVREAAKGVGISKTQAYRVIEGLRTALQ